MCAFALLFFAVLTGQISSRAAETEALRFPHLRVYTSDQIGTPGKIWSAAQDSDGVIYFGGAGVISFDGDRWRTWSMNGTHGIRGLAFGEDGRLWAAGHGEIGWFEHRGPALEYHSLVGRLPEKDRDLPESWSAIPLGAGAVFIDDTKIMRWNGSAFDVEPMRSDNRIRPFQAGGKIYVHQYASGLNILTPNGRQVVIPAAALGDTRVWWARPTQEGWRLLTGNGFATYKEGRLIEDNSELNTLIKQAFAGLALELPDGRLAIATVYGGAIIAETSGANHQVIDRSTGLPSQGVNGMFVDRDEQLWLLGDFYVASLSLTAKTSVFDQRAGLPQQPIVSIVGMDTRIVAATENGLFELGQGARTFVRQPTETLSIYDLLPTPEGLLSAGFGAIWKTSDGTTSVLRKTPTDVFAIEPSLTKPGSYILSENLTVLRMAPRNQIATLAQNLPEAVTSLAEDRDGNVWLSSLRSGVLYLAKGNSNSPGKATPPPPAAGLPALRSPVIVAGDRSGAVYVLSREGGWRKPANASRFAEIAAFPRRDVSAVSPAYASDEIWLIFRSTEKNPPMAGTIKVDGASARWEPREIESLDAISSPRSIFAQKQADGTSTLWIGGTGGVIRSVVREHAALPLPRPPLLRPSAVTAEGALVASIDEPLDYSTRSILFELAAPEFGRRESLRLETFVEGIDRDWIPAGADSRRELPAVRDGRYRLQARAVADTGAASELTTFDFTVLAPWWRRAPFLIGMAVALVPAGFAAVRLRTRALRRHNAELEAKVRSRTEELEAANAAKTDFVANMSHDIRNPLNGIVGLALALEDSRLDGRQREIVATLRECTTYLSTLVDDVLDFASIEAGKVELRPGPFAPAELLRSIVTTLKSDTAERGATLTFEVDPDLPLHLLGDAGRVQQILVNFVSNALKYAGEKIHLSATRPANGPGEVEFSVRDWGEGIGAEEQETLFKKFSRLSRVRQKDIPGAGLGLASCRMLADIMGGSVGVESRPGDGSRFYLRLPLTIVTEAPDPVPDILPETVVLLVEDTEYNAWAAKAVLARLGLACDRARTGEEAVRMFEQKRYNVVLLDRNLPDMDGIEVARRIRSSETDGLQAVILAVTAYCTAEDRKLCLEAGMDAFVGKPLTPDKLRRTLLAAGRKLLATATVDVSREAPVAPAAELDLSLLNYLSDGSEESMATQVRRFLDTLSGAQAESLGALRAGDFETLKVYAHRIIGQARMVGSNSLAATALRLEKAAEVGDGNACGVLLRRVTAEIGALTEAMLRLPRSMSPV